MTSTTTLAFGTSALPDEMVDQRTFRLFTSLLEQSEELFFVLPAPATNLSFVTPITAKVLGYEGGDLVSHPVKTFLSPSSLITICDALHRAAASGIAVDGIISLIPYPVELIKKDRTIILGKVFCILLMSPEHTVITIGGRITLEQEPLDLLRKKLSLPEKKDSIVTEKVGPAYRQGRVLIMDDEDILIDIALQMGRRLGLLVEAVKNGADAIEKYRDAFILGHPYDAVLLDMTISGGIGGIEVSKELHRINPEVKSIVMSGYADHDVMSHPERYGFAAVITKPFRLSEFREIIQQVLPPDRRMESKK